MQMISMMTAIGASCEVGDFRREENKRTVRGVMERRGTEKERME
jgi:hypothetical protein